MSDTTRPPAGKILDPVDRVAEVLFGLIMVLTFTGSLSVAQAGRDDVRAMLIGALGCNLAWGIIDGVFHLMGRLAEKSRQLALFHAVRAAPDAGQARQIITGALPEVVAAVLPLAEIEALHQRLRQLPEPPRQAHLDRADVRSALGVFALVFLSTLPVVLPFLFMRPAVAALRVSHFIAVAMLFLAGYAYARGTGRSPWLTGLGMVALGLLLVAITIMLGG